MPIGHGADRSLITKDRRAEDIFMTAFEFKAHSRNTLVASLIGLVVLLMVRPALARPPAGSSAIKHVIILMKENHTYDNYFGKSGIGDGVTAGTTHDGQTVALVRPPDLITPDIALS